MVKVKGKVVPVLFLTEHHAMKVYWGVEVKRKIPSPYRDSNPDDAAVAQRCTTELSTLNKVNRRIKCKYTFYLYNTKLYPKVSGLVPWGENYKWYSCLPLGAIVSLFCEPV
jgi:hypothetical protein